MIKNNVRFQVTLSLALDSFSAEVFALYIFFFQTALSVFLFMDVCMNVCVIDVNV